MFKASLLAAIVGLAGLTGEAWSALSLRGPDMVYDDSTNLTWLRDAGEAGRSAYDDGHSATDGLMTFTSAQAWVSQLSIVYPGNGQTFSDWRLPSYDPMTGPSEIADLVQRSLGNPPPYVPRNWGPFFPAPNSFAWLGSPYGQSLPTRTFLSIEGWVVRDPSYVWPPELAWASNGFDHLPGVVRLDLLSGATYQQEGYAWAVRSGDVAAIPEPTVYGLLIAGLGLVVFATRKRRNILNAPQSVGR